MAALLWHEVRACSVSNSIRVALTPAMRNSTGGTPGKKKGRVGDVPIVGGGFYADDETVAVSCTGWGEGLMRMSAAYSVAAMVRAGQPLQAAVEETLAKLLSRLDGRAGIIAVDRNGNVAAAYTTPYMGFAGPAASVRKMS
jgi:beta-aspartyl-peptidase (threonine type)